MFQAKQFIRTGSNAPVSNVQSAPMNDILVAFEKDGFNPSGFNIIDSQYGTTLYFGEFPDGKNLDRSKPFVRMNVGNSKNPLALEGETKLEKLKELMEYPVYFGTATHVRKNDLNEDEDVTSHWMTIGKAGTFDATPAEKLPSFKDLISGKNITTVVA